jgi:cytochrome b6-f complex iron-sulfur subunit
MADEPKPTDITATPPTSSPTDITATPPAAPPKPAAAPPAPPAKKDEPTRRNVLVASAMGIFGSWFAIAWLALGASTVGFLLGCVRFLFPNVLSEPPSKFKVGERAAFEDGKVNERFKDQGAWIVRYQGQIYALSTTCTHLGCTPNWLEAEQKFKCPCHGSGFKITGVNFEGPAPRPLERWALSVGDDGQLVVDKSKKFQKELGQWTNPESFVKI